jgi:predicted HTH domain antitoxin
VFNERLTMLSLRDFFELIDYRITEGSDYGWQCYGGHAHAIDCTADNYSLTVIFDRENQTVYEVTVCDYRNDRAYRMIHSDYESAHTAEAQERGVDADRAWDEVNYVDLETEEDFVEKARAIIASEDYDTRISIPIDLPEDELLTLFKMAHQRDMTFNDFMVEIITEHIAAMNQEVADHGAEYVRQKYQNVEKNSQS